MINRTEMAHDLIAISRRGAIKTTMAAAGAFGIFGPAGGFAPHGAFAARKLPLTMAGYKFDRLAALVDGRVGVEGCEVSFEQAAIGDMNSDVFGGPQTRDVTEIGLHPFMLAYANEGFRDYVLLPIFPLRTFRHRSVFIRTDRGIKTPHDLRGRRIATPGYSSTSLTWIRGIFQDEYGIAPKQMRWVLAGKDSSADVSGQISKQETVRPQDIAIEQGPAGMDESDLLESGAVDALFHAAEPRAYINRHPQVARLFPDYRAVERAYFKRTGIFPIMHTVAIKRSTVDQNPWLVEAVFKAYAHAKRLNYQYMAQIGWAYESLPWYAQEFEETRALMGTNFYAYGIKPNRKTLKTLFRYSHQQGLANRELSITDLFQPASLDLAEETVR